MEENSENLSENTSEETSEEISENTSEDTSEDSSETTSEIVVETIPEETLNQISDLHTLGVMGLAMFGTMFFLWLFDFLYKKLAHYF